MKFKIEIDLNDAAFDADPQMVLANMLHQVGMWIRELPAPLGSGAIVNLYGNGGEAAPPVGKAWFGDDPPPFKKR